MPAQTPNDKHPQYGSNAGAESVRDKRFRLLKEHLKLADYMLGPAAALNFAGAGYLFDFHDFLPGLMMFGAALAFSVGLFQLHYRHGYRRKQRVSPWSWFFVISGALLMAGALVPLALIRMHPKPSKISVRIRAAIVYIGSGPLSLFMVKYPSMYGETISPVYFLLYVEVDNLGSTPVAIDGYKFSLGGTVEGPWKYLAPIPLSASRLYSLGTVSRAAGNRIVFPGGTSLLKRSMQGQDLTHAALLEPKPVLDTELSRPVQPGETYGWAAFDSATDNPPDTANVILVTLNGAGHATYSNIVTLPEGKQGLYPSGNIHLATLYATGVTSNLTECHVRHFTTPYPSK